MKKGFTLIEVLVSLFIFTLVILAAYKIYDHSQKTYLLGEQLTDTQQSTRFAFEKLAHDLRVAGYRVYPDSDALRPDLAIEGMWPGAIAVRADFDREEETDLECTKNAITNDCETGTGQYGMVTTGNGDVRVYVLKSSYPAGHPKHDAGTEIAFKADFSAPRDAIVGNAGTLETVTLAGVAMTQDKPPYKLYQVTFLDPSDDGYSAVPSGGDVPAGNIVWTPVADNVFSMSFDYFNQNGIADENRMEADPDDVSEPEDRPLFRREHGWPFGGVGGSNTVKNVVVSIVGMTGRPDGKYTDPQINNTDLTTEELAAREATKMHRKYELSSTINMMNVGVAPHELADTVPPDDPTQLLGVPGYCGGILFTWNKCHAEDLAAYWIQVVDDSLWGSWGSTFKYNCDDAPATCYATSNPEPYDERVGFFVRNLTNGAAYHSRVFAQDSAGNFSRNPTNQVDVIVNPSPLKPSPPTWPDPAAIAPIPPDSRPLSEIVDIGGLSRLQLNFTPPVTYDTTQNVACSQPSGGDPTPLDDDGAWPQIRDLMGYRLYHTRQLSTVPDPAAAAWTPVPEQLVADEKTPASDPLQIPRASYPDLKACPCEHYAYKMAAVTDCEDADDDYSQTPPCTHFGEVSELSKDPAGTAAAVRAPMIQADLGVYPQVVPGKPGKPSAFTAGLGGGDYDITLRFPPVLLTALRNEPGDANYTIPNPDVTAQFEVWRYRIYEYAGNPDVDGSLEPVLVPDANIVADDFADDFDAGLDADPAQSWLQETNPLHFKFQTNIPSGEFRYYAVRGLYRCGDDNSVIIEGPRSEAVQVPCDTDWDAVIVSPAVDYALVTGGSNIWPVVLQVSNIPAGVTITSVTVSIPQAGISDVPVTCSGTPTECTATYNWDTNGLPDGSYVILFRVVDSSGCEETPTRIANISQACGPFSINAQAPSGNQLTWEIVKDNDTQYFLLERIGFNSQTYTYLAMDFFETVPLPASVPITLWHDGSGVGVDLSGKLIGSATSAPTYFYEATNFCSGDPSRRSVMLHRHANSPAGAGNWFRASLDKDLTSANGPLNLLASFTYKQCDQIEIAAPVIVPRKGPGTVNLTRFPVCTWTWTFTGKEPTVDWAASDLCAGKIVFNGAISGPATVTVTAYAPSAAFTCEFVPILLGP